MLDAIVLRDESPLLALVLVEARFGAGTHELYQLPLGVRPAAEGWSEGVIAERDGADRLRRARRSARTRASCCTDAPATTSSAARRRRCASTGPSRDAAAGGDRDVRTVGVEQSNTSIVFDEPLS